MDLPAPLDLPVDNAYAPPRNSPRRQQVIDAAAAIFSRMGFHGASTRAIADMLGMKVASLYFHIESKDDALEEICVLGTHRSKIYLQQAFEHEGDLAGRIRHFFRLLGEDYVSHADYVNVSIHEGRYLTANAKARLAAVSRAFRAELDAMFEAAAANGELHPQVTPRLARFMVIATMRSSSELYARGNIRDFDNIMLAWVEALIRSLSA
jgi:AcrR family transcriptional regulator